MSNEQLVSEIQNGTNVQINMLQLYDQNIGFIRSEAIKCSSRKEDLEDMLQEAYLVLVDAADKYDPNKGSSFIYFFGKLLSWHYFEVWKKKYSISYHLFEDIFKLWKAADKTPEEIKKIYHWTEVRYQKIKQAATSLDPVSLDVKNDSDCSLYDVLAINDPKYEKLEDQEENKCLWDIVDTLSPEEKMIIKSIYIDGDSIKQITEKTDLKQSLIIKLKKKAFETLRKKDEIKDIAISKGFRCSGLSYFRRHGSSSTEEAAIYLLDHNFDIRDLF